MSIRKSVSALILALLTGCEAAPPAPSAPSGGEADAQARRAAVRGAIGTYAGIPCGPDGKVDFDRLLRELDDIRANTYHWLIARAGTDWEDLHRFLPLAREKGLRVWVTLLPPSESRPNHYSEPFRLDYERWAEELAKLAAREPALVAWSVDDFAYNLKIMTPDRMRAAVAVSRKIAPKFAFVPCVYYKQVTPKFCRDYAGTFDAILFPYRSESTQANLSDPAQVGTETNRIREMAGGVPVILDVYATAHSRLGDSTPEYVKAVIESGLRCADGVLIYRHQDPERNAGKYRVVREAFRARK